MKKYWGIFFSLLLLPLSASASFSHNLSYGTTGTDVSQLQQFLSDEGLYSGSINATFGTQTLYALEAFQTQQHISPASGYFGPTTRAVANQIVAQHPEWTTSVSNTGYYKNVNGNSISRPTTSSNGIPAGATAQCRDGSYSFSLNHRGTCSHHGGVSTWL